MRRLAVEFPPLEHGSRGEGEGHLVWERHLVGEGYLVCGLLSCAGSLTTGLQCYATTQERQSKRRPQVCVCMCVVAHHELT